MVPELFENEPPLFVQSPETKKEPELDGAVNEPLDKITVVASTVPLEDVNVPPDMARTPVKV